MSEKVIFNVCSTVEVKTKGILLKLTLQICSRRTGKFRQIESLFSILYLLIKLFLRTELLLNSLYFQKEIPWFEEHAILDR